MGATITTMSKTLECSLHLKCSLIVQDAKPLQQSSKTATTRVIPRVGPRLTGQSLKALKGGRLEVTEAVEQMGRVCWARGRNWTPEMDHSRDTSSYATATSSACHFLPILPPKPLLPHRLSPPPSPTSPSPTFPLSIY